MDNRENAKKLMQHYFGLLAEKCGIQWDFDNSAEIDELTDSLIDAAKQEIRDENWRETETKVKTD